MLIHIDRKLDRMVDMLSQILKVDKMAAVDIAAITAGVTRNTSVLDSTVLLINNLTALIKAIPPSTDPVTQAALDQLTATLTANDDAAAAAVVANTPAA
jgi:hypothetical protein